MSEQKRTNVHLAGSGRISGGVYDTVIVAGSGRVTEDVEAEKFLSRGGFEIGGLLSAEEIKIELGGGKVSEIGGRASRCGSADGRAIGEEVERTWARAWATRSVGPTAGALSKQIRSRATRSS
jgi:hypothetical protein